MKVILSRKGFDSSNGGIPSPIMPDGTLLSMPIPMQKDDDSYSDIQWNGMTYQELLQHLAPGRSNSFDNCHIDPDIRDNRIIYEDGWTPAFGQVGAAQGKLNNTKNNANVEVGDLFLFFGWFRKTVRTEAGYCFAKRSKDDIYAGNDLHVIYGYMQVGEIIRDQERIKQYSWHPHSKYTSETNNVLYLPRETLSFAKDLKGYETLDFRKDRVLTKEGCSRAVWNDYPFLMPEHIASNVKNSSKGEGLYYAGIWQEMVVLESPKLIDWVERIIR